ncbi:MAG: hypothetical protein ACRCTP_17720 [Aeromonas popoffii]|uniref:hypothetical protein n=1 Tax=Aeromonas popoffii TaxID=70856 RepID=UPI003F3FDCF7
MKKHTILTLILVAFGLAFVSASALSAEQVSLWGKSHEPAPADPFEKAPQKAPEELPVLNSPKGAVDKLEDAIRQGESLEQQGRRIKRLFDR